MSSERNTTYLVELSANAAVDLEEIYFNINGPNSPAAARWFNALEELVFSLRHMPQRGIPTHEDRNLRQLLHGNKPHVYRVIYSIDRATRHVHILHIRHGARSQFDPAEIEPQT